MLVNSRCWGVNSRIGVVISAHLSLGIVDSWIGVLMDYWRWGVRHLELRCYWTVGIGVL